MHKKTGAALDREVALAGRNAIPAPFIAGVAMGSSEAPRTIAVQFIARR
jgi:hypothetical protein